MPQPSFLHPQNHLPEMWKKPFQRQWWPFVPLCKGLVTHGVVGSVLNVTMQESMPGCCQGHGAPLTIVLGATGGSF